MPVVSHLQAGDSGIIPDESEGLITRGAKSVNLNLRPGKEQCLSSSRREGRESSFPFPFGLLRPSTDWTMSTLVGRAVYSTESTASRASAI